MAKTVREETSAVASRPGPLEAGRPSGNKLINQRRGFSRVSYYAIVPLGAYFFKLPRTHSNCPAEPSLLFLWAM